jgi:hypothetical protein
MAQATHASIPQALSAQEAAAAIVRRINEKPSTPTVEEIATLIGKPACQGSFIPTIRDVAAELPRLYDLRETMATGDFRQNQREDGLDGTPPSSRPKHHAFEILRDRTHVQVKALESLIFLLEPENADEALSLLLLTDSAFHEFAAEAYEERDLPADQEVTWNTVGRALHAIVRWLYRTGALSPLLKEHFAEDNLVPPSRQTAEAMSAAKELEAWHKTQVEVQ